jgi:hypothetical protein
VLWCCRPKLQRCGGGQVGPFPMANASPDIARWRGRALAWGGVPAVRRRAEGGKGGAPSYWVPAPVVDGFAAMRSYPVDVSSEEM